MRNIAAAVGDVADMPREKCVTLGDSSEVKQCLSGPQSSDRSLVLFGDSHAIHWFNAVQRLAKERGWKLTTIVKSGCPATDVSISGAGARFEARCSAWRWEAIRTIISMRPSLVIIGNSNTYLDGEGRHGSTRVDFGHWREGTRRTVQAFTSQGLRVVLLRDVPRPPFDIPSCLARSARHSWFPGRTCQFDEGAAMAWNGYAAEKQAIEGLTNASILDMNDQICQKGLCAATQKGLIVYRDDNHLAGQFAERLSPVLAIRLPSF